MAWALKVLDLSHHNVGPGGDPIDFGAIAAFNDGLIKGVILKATQGTTYTDPRYRERKEAARAAGLLVGAYHFNTGEDVGRQVDHFFDIAEPDENMILALDFESYPPSQMSLHQARQFLELGDARLGRSLWLYTGNRFKELSVREDEEAHEFFGQHPLWLAQYGPEPKMENAAGAPLPWAEPTLWQFSGDSINNPGWDIPGIDPSMSKKIDLNAYGKSDDLFVQDWSA